MVNDADKIVQVNSKVLLDLADRVDQGLELTHSDKRKMHYYAIANELSELVEL